jgi:hypothetical protein
VKGLLNIVQTGGIIVIGGAAMYLALLVRRIVAAFDEATERCRIELAEHFARRVERDPPGEP